MAVKRVEIAVLADDAEEEAVPLVSAFVQAIGLDTRKDVSGVITSDENGDPVLVAVIYPGAGEDTDVDPTDLLVDDESNESDSE